MEVTETLELKAGRELDALIAERVMGLVRCQGDFHDESFPNTYCFAQSDFPTMGGELREYSTDIGAAWEVLGRLADQGLSFRVESYNGICHARFFELDENGNKEWKGFAPASTAPEAICLAALKTVA